MKRLSLVLGMTVTVLLVLLWICYQGDHLKVVNSQESHGVQREPVLKSDNTIVSVEKSTTDESLNASNLAQSSSEEQQIHTQTKQTDGFNLDPVNALDVDELNRLAKNIDFLQNKGVVTLSDDELAEVQELQSHLYGQLALHPTELYIESPLREYMVYLSPEQVLKLERLVASQTQPVQ